jgi:hypothetical protein
MNDLYELFNNMDLIKDGNPNLSQIEKMSMAQIFDLAENAISLTPMNREKHKKSLFAHSSSISLGGGRFPCNGISCRTNRARELAQFAAFYSEKIYIRNYFSDYLSSHNDDDNDNDLDALKNKLRDDISLFILLEPLIVSGKIIPITPPNIVFTAC